jgi:ankyrin repeat protein
MSGGKRAFAALVLLVAGLGAGGGCFEKTNTYAKQQALATAVQQGDFMRTRALIESGADVNVAVDGSPPLCQALERNHADIALLLMAHGATVNEGYMPLGLAAQRSNAEVVTALLDHNYDVNAQDQAKRTALHWAVSESRLKIVEILVEHGADVNAKDEIGQTPLQLAQTIKSEQSEAIVKYLVAHGAK